MHHERTVFPPVAECVPALMALVVLVCGASNDQDQCADDEEPPHRMVWLETWDAEAAGEFFHFGS